MINMNIASDDYTCSPSKYDASPCIYLNDDQVEALGIKGMSTPGTVIMLMCKALVTSTTATAEEADEVGEEGKAPDVSLSLRITDMEVTRTGSSTKDTAKALYGD
jgi:hypothetical protein